MLQLPRMHKGNVFIFTKTGIYLTFLVIGWGKIYLFVPHPQECIKRVKLTCIHFLWNFESTQYFWIYFCQ